MIGDKDPEDAWDDDDPIDVRLALIIRILAAIVLDLDTARAGRRRLEVARLLHKMAVEIGNG